MPAAFRLQVATPERVVLTEEITSLIVPGAAGYLGVKARHAPLVAELQIGRMWLRRTDGREVNYAIEGGILEVSGDGALVLADCAEAPEEVDIARAEAALERAKRRLSAALDTEEPEIDVTRAQLSLARAANRLLVAARYRAM